jgi:mRNA-degrading endonuclease RelE of RelBE toxin-antitoxin system
MFEIRYHDRVISEDLPSLPSAMRSRIRAVIEQRLMVDPISYGKPLRYSLRGHRRLRVGDWRIVYRVDMGQRLVFVVAIDHRKDVYDE